MFVNDYTGNTSYDNQVHQFIFFITKCCEKNPLISICTAAVALEQCQNVK